MRIAAFRTATPNSSSLFFGKRTFGKPKLSVASLQIDGASGVSPQLFHDRSSQSAQLAVDAHQRRKSAERPTELVFTIDNISLNKPMGFKSPEDARHLALIHLRRLRQVGNSPLLMIGGETFDQLERLAERRYKMLHIRQRPFPLRGYGSLHRLSKQLTSSDLWLNNC